MEKLKKMFVLVIAMLAIGVCSEQVQAAQVAQVTQQQVETEVSHETLVAKKKQNTVVDIKYNKNAKARNGRICNDYYENKVLRPYGVNAKGQRVKTAVTVKEHGKFLYPKKGKIYLTLECEGYTKRIVIKGIVQVKKVTVNRNGVKLVENQKVSKKMFKDVIFRTTWQNGHLNKRYKGAQCLDLGKTIKGTSFKVRFKVGNKIVTVKFPVIHQHVWSKWSPKGLDKHERKCITCKKTEIRAHGKAPQNLKYVCKSPSKNAKTHTLEATYYCPVCRAKIVLKKDEKCSYEVSYEEGEEEDSHIEVQTCLICKNRKEEKQKCKYDISYQKLDGDMHIKVQSCQVCQNRKKETQDCEYGNWEYAGNDTDITNCIYCNYQRSRDHEHDTPPEDIEYVHNGLQGTGDEHELEGHYNCLRCLRTVTLTKKEKCVYEISSYMAKGGNRHLRISTCKTCKAPKEENENCQYGNWRYIGNLMEATDCVYCGYQKTRGHIHETPSNIKYEYKGKQENGVHELKGQYHCSICLRLVVLTKKEPCAYTISYAPKENEDKHIRTKVCSICQNRQEDELDCEYDANWVYIGNNTDETHCMGCNRSQTREHVHEPEPEGLAYQFKSSNNNGTHELEASYFCGICQKTVSVSQNEDCLYGDVSYEQTGVNDIHKEVRSCQVCQYRQEKEGACVPVGELKYVTVYSQIYEYYDCELCKAWCKRKYHEHKYDTSSWEYYDSDTHRKYCLCGAGEARLEEEHNFVYDKENSMMSCAGCQYSMPVAPHEHGYDTCDEMGLMDIINSPAYAEILSASQKPNPNPSPESWCSRYEFRCHTCGIKYYIYYNHKFVNGKCTRTGYCGGIEQPGGVSSQSEEIIEEKASKEIYFTPNINIPFIDTPQLIQPMIPFQMPIFYN